VLSAETYKTEEFSPMDLKIVNASLPDRTGTWDIAIDNGQITDIRSSIPNSAKTVLEAQGRLVIPGLVDAHIHLDKVFLLERCQRSTGTFDEAIRETLNAKQRFTIADIQDRARRAIEHAIAFGTTTMRSHVEVDSTVQLTGIRALLPLRQEYAWGLTLQLAVFAQEGITNQPGIEDLLKQALRLGADLIGSAPYVDPDPERNIGIVFDIAQEFNCDVDFHLDFLDDDQPLLLPYVIEQTRRRGWQGRVCLGHMTKLAGLLPDDLKPIATALAETGLSVLALPASDLYMMARQDSHDVRRGVAPIHWLNNWGVTCGVATNNLQNLFTPFGDGDVLKICTLLAQVLHLGTVEQHQHCLAMVTTEAAKAIGFKHGGLLPGQPADLVVLGATSVSEAIGAAPSDRIVIKNGQIVVKSLLDRQWFFHNS
jgi:cytosine deaminase